MSMLTSSVLAVISGLGVVGICLGGGLTIVGAGLALGMIGGKALDAIARQPEASSRILSTMIIAAALIEGVTFFSLLIGFLALYFMKTAV